MPKRGENGRTLRSAHLGYDLYVTGALNGSVGRVRIIQRPTRMPPNITLELKSMLPVEMWWPQRDLQQAMACVDACLTMDIAQLQRWKEQFPDNVFGYEQYIDRLKRLRAAQGTNTPNAHGRGGPGKLTPLQLSHFPSQVEEILPYYELAEHAYVVKIAVVKFQDHTSALRFTIYGRLAPGSDSTRTKHLTKLSRAYVDPVSGEFDIIEHFPGRYQALELPQNILQTTLGVRNFKLHRREGSMKARPVIPSDLRGTGKGNNGANLHGSPAYAAQMNHATQTMGDSVRVQSALMGNGGKAGRDGLGDHGMRSPRPRQRKKTTVEGTGPAPERVFEEGVVP